MKFLLHTMATPDLTPIEALDLARELGFDGIDLVCQRGYRCALPPDAPLEAARRLRREAEMRGLVIGAFTPYEKSIDRPDNAASISALCHAIRLGAAVGASSVRLLAGHQADERQFEERLPGVVAAIGTLAAEAQAMGIGLNVENHDGSMADTAERTARIVGRVDHPAAGIIYDPANLIRDSRESFPLNLELQAGLVRLVHVKDYAFAAGRALSATDDDSRRCVPMGDGDVPWAEIFGGLRDIGYSGFISLEYEMRWWPDQLLPVRIGAARSLEYMASLCGTGSIG